MVTDDEAAIVSAIKKFLPEMDLFRCFNHVANDIKRKIGTIVGLNAEEKKLYMNQCRELFSQKSKTNYLELLAERQIGWNQQFGTYYVKNIHPDIDRIGAWVCNKYGVGKITTNQSESVNNLIKGLNDWKECPIDAMVLSLFQLSQYYNAEIIRGRYNYGQHRILPELAHVYKEENDKPILPEIVDTQTIIQTIKEAEKDVNAHFKKCETNVEEKQKIQFTNYDQEKLSMYERALSVINDKDGISMRPKTGEFIVKGTLGTSHVVTIFPKVTCTCAGSGHCYHVLACDMAIGQRQTNSKKPNVTAYRKRRRKFGDKRSGRKRPRKLDKPPKIDKSETMSGNDDNGEWDGDDALFLKDIMHKKHHSLPKDEKDKQKDVPNTTISPTKKTFSDYYESSDFDSNTSFGSEKDRRREKAKEAARDKWNYDQIIRLDDLFPEVDQPKVKEEICLIDEKVFDLYIFFTCWLSNI